MSDFSQNERLQALFIDTVSIFLAMILTLFWVYFLELIFLNIKPLKWFIENELLKKEILVIALVSRSYIEQIYFARN